MRAKEELRCSLAPHVADAQSAEDLYARDPNGFDLAGSAVGMSGKRLTRLLWDMTSVNMTESEAIAAFRKARSDAKAAVKARKGFGVFVRDRK